MREFSAAPAQGTLSYTYDAAGNVASIKSSNANGVWASYTYDEMGRLGTVVDNRLQGQQTTTYSYDAGVPVDRSSSTGWDAASNLATAAYPNQLQSTLNYDTLNRLTALSTPVSSYSYTLGPTGNRTNATEGNGRTLAWTYDNIYRLTNEAVTNDPAPASKNGSVAYTLDPVGNRKSVSSSLSGVNTAGPVTFNPDDELASGQGETYDNNGNTTLTGGRSFTFDAENHLISMNQGSTLVTLLYDGDGNRVAKTVGSVTTRYLVDDLNPTGYPQVVDELVGGAVTRQYTYGLDRISENQFVGGGWTPSFYGVDGGGSVRQLTNSSGTVTDTYEYDAFGNRVSSTGTTPNNYLYRGEQYDPDLSLYYLRARYYNQVTGRFLNVDPLAGQGQRRYEYAGANPVDGSDPSGNFVLASYWPLMAPLQINIPFPSWCSQAGSGTMGSDLPPCKDHPMLGVGIELPAPKAVHNNVFNPAVDYGHTFLYLKGDYGDILSIFSFGPIDPAPPHELSHFLAGTLPGNGHWHLDPVANTWSFPISEDQLFNGVIDIDAFKANPPNYTPTFQCTSAAVSMAAKIGVSLPSGVGPTKARKYLHTFYNGQVANPYHLNQQMTSEFGPPTVVNTNTFPNP